MWAHSHSPLLETQGLRQGGAYPSAWEWSQAAHCFFFFLQEVDWEVELAVIIGRKGKHIKVRWKSSCQWSVALGDG